MLQRILLLSFLFLSFISNGWVYPEHRRIALLAIQKLNPQQRRILDSLWALARTGHESRLTESIIEPEQGIHPTHIDYAAWAGISGDHSCSPKDMLDIVLQSDWILNVASVAARLEAEIRDSKNQFERVNALRASDIRLQRADAQYATRAGSNNVHFLLARPEVDTHGDAYYLQSHQAGAELNAIGMYSWFHTSAMYKMARAKKPELGPSERASIILSALADEAFGIHFLEDVFAAGHTAGTWGVASVRKGTHDFYNEHGLEVTTWDGKRAILLGDAYMRPEDAELASFSVNESIQQLIQVSTGQIALPKGSTLLNWSIYPDTFNVCKNNFQPARAGLDTTGTARKETFSYLATVLRRTPVPGLATGKGELPRFRAELGPFFGVSTSLNGSYALGGFGSTQNNNGFVGGLAAGMRFGVGLEGVLNESGDGLIFFQAGIRQDASSSHNFLGDASATPAGAITSAIPGRAGWDFRMRLPFWLLPGDLVIIGPILYLINPQRAQEMGVIAVNGGLIPWQSGFQTGIGRFQFILGREIGVSLYGTKTFGNDAIFVPTPSGNQVISYSSVKWDFPFLEYRPFRTFSLNQASSLMIQFNFGVDTPNSSMLLGPPGAVKQPLHPVWYIGARVVFDWRKYL